MKGTRWRNLLALGGWWVGVGLWTAALLTTYPVEINKAVLPPEAHFPAAKGLHVTAYAFLTVWASWLPLGRWRWLLVAFLSLHGAGTEFLQTYVPGRSGQVSDVVIDHVGILLGLAVTWKRWLPYAARHRPVADSVKTTVP
jgi:VanZ family protein